MARSSAKRRFARLVDGKAVEFIDEHTDIDQEWHPDFLKMCVDVTDAVPSVEIGWILGEDGKMSASPTPPPDPRHAANVALAVGCTVKSGKSSVIYCTSGTDWQRMLDLAQHISVFKVFPGGSASLDWKAQDGTIVKFRTIEDFLTIVMSISDWIHAWRAHGEGLGNAPSAEVIPT